jgi:hypothetical protein
MDPERVRDLCRLAIRVSHELNLLNESADTGLFRMASDLHNLARCEQVNSGGGRCRLAAGHGGRCISQVGMDWASWPGRR